jgi:FG-GAP-like repeat
MKVLGKILLFILIVSGFCAGHSGATVYYSNGSAANVQAVHDYYARDGDIITLPAGTFSWTSRLNITKGITLQGATMIVGSSWSPTVSDATIIRDNIPRNGPSTGIISAQLNSSQSFRLTGITFRHGSSTAYGNNGAIRVTSTGSQPNSSVRIDHCHFDHLYWAHTIWIHGWIYGVEDHNMFDCTPANLSHLIWHNTWGNQANGNGSWADFPYYGTEKFWFIEDNTIRGNGPVTSGTIDSTNGGRYVARHNAFFNASLGGHGTEGGPQRGARAREVYDNVFRWRIGWSGHMQRSGGSLWHDNQWVGIDSNNQNHTSLAVFREIGAIGNDLSFWGLAGGNNPWDINDPHGLYETGTDSGSVNSRGVVRDSGKHWSANEWAGYSVTNTNPSSRCYNHSAYIISNTTNTITYAYYPSGDRGAPLVFNAGDTYAIYRVLTALDQNGRGKGDLISAASPPAWPNEALEPCFSWNNVHLTTGHAYGFGSQYPTEIANRDYYNLGAGFPRDSTPAHVSATYTAALNGIDYVGPFIYPHPFTLLPVGTARAVVRDFNGDGSPDYVLQKPSTHQTAIWYLNNNVYVGSDAGPNIPANWGVVGAADFNGDGKPDYVLQRAGTHQTAIAYMDDNVCIAAAWGPALPPDWELVGAADFNGDGKPDYSLYNVRARRTAIAYMNDNVCIGAAWGPALPRGWELVAAADFNGDGKPDYSLYNVSARQTAIAYLDNNVCIGAAWGPTLPPAWTLVGSADFNGDGHPDYLLYNVNTQETGIYYLDNNLYLGAAWGPTPPPGWSFFGP